MSDFKYTPDEEIAIHRIGAIKHMCRPFLSHENGLPELVKNSAAAYLREDRKPNERIITLIFARGRGKSGARIGCLDLVGMTSEQIERDFRHWADPEAATRATDRKIRVGELGGHGNGGKCYMTQMFEGHAILHTVRRRVGCRYGVGGGRVDFGYVPDVKQGKDFRVNVASEEIEGLLRSLGISTSGLPEILQKAVKCASGFTLVEGVKPKDWRGAQVVHNLLESICEHPQMTTPLQLCKIFVVINGVAFNNGETLSLPAVDPMPGSKEPRIIKVPEILDDPVSRQEISTIKTADKGARQLLIFTSEKNMRTGRGAKRQWRHTVNFHTTESGIIGRIPMSNLDVDSSYRDYMYCDCHLDSLDQYQRNDRGPLAESPLTRAVNAWISGQVREYCREFEARERQHIRRQDRDQLSRINEWLDKWKNKFMQELISGLYGEGEGIVTPLRPALPSGTPTSIEVTTSYPMAGIGVYMRPIIKFFDCNNRRVRPVPYKWVSEDNNIAMVDEELMQIQTFVAGQTTIWAETLDRRVRSNKISLEVVRVGEIRVVPKELEMPAGTRRHLEATCRLPNGEDITGVHLTWLEDDSSIARVTSSGLVFGIKPGKTKVTAIDESCKSDIPATIVVTSGEGTGEGSRKGRGYPMVLVSEIDTAPEEEQPALFRADEPPVMQRPKDVDNNIWWINLASPFARLYFNDNRYGVKSEAWRIYHVERYIDIIVQIALANGPDCDKALIARDWLFRNGELEADIRKKAIESLVDFIHSGEMA